MIVVCNPARIVDRLKPKVDDHILEIGCGAGRILIPLAERVPEAEVHGFDLQKKMLAKARRYANDSGVMNIELRQGNITDDEIGRERYDLVYLVTVLGEVPRRHQVFRKIVNSIKPGGRLSITEVIPDPCYLTINTVTKLAQENGMSVTNTYKGLLAYTVDFEKQ